MDREEITSKTTVNLSTKEKTVETFADGKLLSVKVYNKNEQAISESIYKDDKLVEHTVFKKPISKSINIDNKEDIPEEEKSTSEFDRRIWNFNDNKHSMLNTGDKYIDKSGQQFVRFLVIIFFIAVLAMMCGL